MHLKGKERLTDKPNHSEPCAGAQRIASPGGLAGQIPSARVMDERGDCPMGRLASWVTFKLMYPFFSSPVSSQPMNSLGASFNPCFLLLLNLWNLVWVFFLFYYLAYFPYFLQFSSWTCSPHLLNNGGMFLIDTNIWVCQSHHLCHSIFGAVHWVFIFSL